ncbi:hypothetical protein CAEBREN_25010 [Caenorhabditis brenneri]|uniref:Uncharacterized protein n=1 Tax=Caenorhabditis brenneri TaxID=135651 RepID=G0MW19_CAEBE|nr:hypothetical protein CAEBREN_25010 [Caenorhabditis brenneri]
MLSIRHDGEKCIDPSGWDDDRMREEDYFSMCREIQHLDEEEPACSTTTSNQESAAPPYGCCGQCTNGATQGSSHSKRRASCNPGNVHKLREQDSEFWKWPKLRGWYCPLEMMISTRRWNPAKTPSSQSSRSRGRRKGRGGCR